jgi:hypothetical protein
MAPDYNDRFDKLTEVITANHVETVQRLTRLETQVVDLSTLPARVNALEHFRFKLAGMATAISVACAYAFDFFKSNPRH